SNPTDGMFRILIDRQNDYLQRGIYSIAGQILTHWTSEYSRMVENSKYYSPEMKKVCDLKVDVTTLANDQQAMDVFTWMSDWNTSMVPIQSIEKTPEGSRIKTQIAASYKLAGTAREYHEVVDFVDSALINVIEGIDTPGKWAVNHKAGKIYLWPFKNTELEKNLYAPTLYELISVHGDMPEGKEAWFSKDPLKPAEYITFEGITFTECGFKLWTDHTPMAQHGWAVCDDDNAMLRFRGVKNCTVKNCTFEKSGGVGVRFDLYAQENIVDGCKFSNLGMEAVNFSGYGAGTRDENHHNAIINNEIGFPGRIKSDVHSITIWQSSFNKIENNYIHDTPYTPILLAGQRFRIFIKHIDDSIPWKDDYYLREGAWEMIRWDEVPDIATFTMALVEARGRTRLDHVPHPDNPQYPKTSPHAGLDYHSAAYRHTQGNVVQFNTFERASDGAYGEVIYISGTKEPGQRNVFSDNYICNCRDAVKPLIWTLYVDGYGRGIEIQRNVIYNTEVIYTGFNNSYWDTYNGWTWKNFSFPASKHPEIPTANIFVDDVIPQLIGRDSKGTIVVDCKTEQDDIHDPRPECLQDYKTIVRNLKEGKFPYPTDNLPGQNRIKDILQDVINNLEE
ncbi:MAG: right-handed parallel beta-helix repeat-containing protein, partial [Planctomycetota bacterium]